MWFKVKVGGGRHVPKVTSKLIFDVEKGNPCFIAKQTPNANMTKKKQTKNQKSAAGDILKAMNLKSPENPMSPQTITQPIETIWTLR